MFPQHFLQMIGPLPYSPPPPKKGLYPSQIDERGCGCVDFGAYFDDKCYAALQQPVTRPVGFEEELRLIEEQWQ